MAEAKATVSWEEFRRWVLVFPQQPWGEAGADLRIGMLGASLLLGLGAKQVTPASVLPWLAPEGESEPEIDWAAKERLLAARMQAAGVIRPAKAK